MKTIAAAVLLLTACVATPATVVPAPPAPSQAAGPTAPPAPAQTPLPELSLATLFHPAPIPAAMESHLRTVIATGDFIPARQVNVEAIAHNDFGWTVRPTADYVKNADIKFVNLETPLFAGCKPSSEGFQFCGDARHVDALKMIGATVVNLANNHAGNFGGDGLQRTVDLLERNGIQVSGLGPAAVVEVRGLRFAFLGFNGVGAAIDRQALVEGVRFARANADVVVVQFHWGKEYERQPMPDPGVPTPDDPVQIGHLAIDSGADLVVGNHPHWYQGVEVYRGKLITYAHGNYVFDQMWSEETRQGVIGKYTFYDNQLVAAEWKPLRIYEYGQARFEDAAYERQVLNNMEQASRVLAAAISGGAAAPSPLATPR